MFILHAKRFKMHNMMEGKNFTSRGCEGTFFTVIKLNSFAFLQADASPRRRCIARLQKIVYKSVKVNNEKNCAPWKPIKILFNAALRSHVNMRFWIYYDNRNRVLPVHDVHFLFDCLHRITCKRSLLHFLWPSKNEISASHVDDAMEKC